MRGDGSGEARTELVAGKRGRTKARRTQISYNPAHGHRTHTARDPTPHSPTAPHRRTTTRGAHARLSAALLRARAAGRLLVSSSSASSASSASSSTSPSPSHGASSSRRRPRRGRSRAPLAPAAALFVVLARPAQRMRPRCDDVGLRLVVVVLLVACAVYTHRARAQSALVARGSFVVRGARLGVRGSLLLTRVSPRTACSKTRVTLDGLISSYA